MKLIRNVCAGISNSIKRVKKKMGLVSQCNERRKTIFAGTVALDSTKGR